MTRNEIISFDLVLINCATVGTNFDAKFSHPLVKPIWTQTSNQVYTILFIQLLIYKRKFLTQTYGTTRNEFSAFFFDRKKSQFFYFLFYLIQKHVSFTGDSKKLDKEESKTHVAALKKMKSEKNLWFKICW